MKAYSEDLRLRVLAAVDGGIPRGEVTRPVCGLKAGVFRLGRSLNAGR